VKRVVLAVFLLAGCKNPYSYEWLWIHTSKGEIVVRLYRDKAPKTVAQLRRLGDQGYYDGMIFHRVVPGYYIQTGDKEGTGSGDPKLPLPDEFTKDTKFDRPGLVGMASWGPGTSQTQFFITLSPQPDLDGQYTLFGEVVEGLEVAKAIAAVPRDARNGDRPYDPPVLKRLRVLAKAP
jgi:cyclophilin family peptidyl-prolyl cis-trans isomerase